MTPHRKFKVEVRPPAIFRRSPEQILIDAEDAAERAGEREPCPLRAELNRAWHAYAEAHGFPEAKGWAAARAHHDPNPSAPSRARREAEAVFARRTAA